jgi:hypothetical protein
MSAITLRTLNGFQDAVLADGLPEAQEHLRFWAYIGARELAPSPIVWVHDVLTVTWRPGWTDARRGRWNALVDRILDETEGGSGG